MSDRPDAHSSPSNEVTRAQDPTVSSVTIGPYRLLQRVGEGGMGEVWLAEQTSPVRRQVALKVIKAGMDTAHVVARFEAERQALAVMDHPAIARVFDAGATPQGRLYFVMEYVRGDPVTVYCNRHRLSTRDRLELFLQVCDGVQHAHQKGIIHRDLKPSNILVTLLDAHPVPKIIDFGVAKATTQPLTDRTLFTELGTLIGTPEYMSPEQAEMTGLDIDTRTDVYALGAVLYELLTGVLTFDAKPLREKGLDEIRRTIREVDPPRPSSRVTSMAMTQSPQSQRPDVFGLASQLRGDLDWITMRALEKDRTRRYGSAADLSADLRRHLDNLPVVASPPSTLYRTGKFVRRHRVGVAVAATLVALLVTFAATTGIQAQRIARERDRANQEAAVAKAVNDFLQNDLLAQASADAQARPDTKPDPDLKVRTALDRAAAQVQAKFGKQPLVEASIRQTIGRTYRDLGLFQEAQGHMEHALELRRRGLGVDHADALASMSDLADLYTTQGKYAEAEALYSTVLNTRRRVLGEQNPDTVDSISDLGAVYRYQGKYAQAEPLLTKALEFRRRVFGNDHRETLASEASLARLFRLQAKYAQAEALYMDVVRLQSRALGAEHPTTLMGMNDLATLYHTELKYAQAEELFSKVVEIERRVLGEDHAWTLVAEFNLGNTYRHEGKVAQAEPLITKALDGYQRGFGEENPTTLIIMNNLAGLHRSQGHYAQAEALLTKVADLQRRVQGAEHPNTLITLIGLAGVYRAQGKYAQAEVLYDKLLNDTRRVLGEEHSDTLTVMHGTALLYEKEGDDARAAALVAKVLQIRRRVLGEENLDTLDSKSELGTLYLRQSKQQESEQLLREAVNAYEKTPSNSWLRYNSRSLLGASLAGQKKYAQAEPLLLSGYEGMVEREAAIPAENRPELRRAGEWIVQLYRDWGKQETAAKWKEKLRHSGASDTPTKP